MARTLKEAGFDIVDSRHDLSALDTRRVLREFADATRDADIAVVYYAGHGIEVEGSNYLIPVDAKLERDTAAAAGAGRASGGGQVFCNGGGCHAVSRGCHLEYRGGGGAGNVANAEVCN